MTRNKFFLTILDTVMYSVIGGIYEGDKRIKMKLKFFSLCKEGDNEALTFIITRYRTAVEALASKYSDSPIERDDLIQEGMIGLLAAIQSFDCSKGTAFSTYCYTCINNSLQTALRKVSRRKDIPQGILVSLEEVTVNNNTALSAEDSFLAKESVSLLTNQLQNELSEFENIVLRLHMIGCSYTEIADKLCKSLKR